MTAIATSGLGEAVGQVTITFGVVNNFDRQRHASDERVAVRRLELADVLMDTGASHLCLPADAVAELGLVLDETVPVETAAGIRMLRVFEGARIEFDGRHATVDVVELDAGARPLFGAIPMEALGVEPDTSRRRVRMLPRGERGVSFLRA
ncbi:MAG: aspartyl protease family protein [Dehalococcoidia bacterium]